MLVLVAQHVWSSRTSVRKPSLSRGGAFFVCGTSCKNTDDCLIEVILDRFGLRSSGIRWKPSVSLGSTLVDVKSHGMASLGMNAVSVAC